MWLLSFISEEDFTNHVKLTIEKYGEKLESFDIKRFNKNIVDPVKLIFDKTVYRATWDEIISNEIFRQRDKSNNNDIGYFHQRIFQYIKNCRVPEDVYKRQVYINMCINFFINIHCFFMTNNKFIKCFTYICFSK